MAIVTNQNHTKIIPIIICYKFKIGKDFYLMLCTHIRNNLDILIIREKNCHSDIIREKMKKKFYSNSLYFATLYC